MLSTRFLALALVALAAILAGSDVEAKKHNANCKAGLPWGADNRWASKMAKGCVKWIHHWENAVVPQVEGKLDYVPMYWGPKKAGKWNDRKKWINKHKPNYILAQNEPDVPGQANLSPKQAASEWIKELRHYQKKGIKISSPQIVYDIKWMDSFMKHLKQHGAKPDFMAVHWYGSWKDTAKLKKYIKRVHKRYNLPVWVSEYGVTQKSHGSQSQVSHFHSKVDRWMDSQPYVHRYAAFGCYAYGNAPDSFGAQQNAFFSKGGKLRNSAYSYMYGASGSKKHGKRDATATANIEAHAARSPGAHRHHNKRVHSLAQAIELQARNTTLDPHEDGEALDPLKSYINGWEVTPEEAEEYFNHDDEEDDKENANADDAEHDDEISRLRDQALDEADEKEDELEKIDEVKTDDDDDDN
ncbi:hypothetical protein FA10DRAFT_263644 [Acaromyces ingoldii]|uniref:Asl1-like glycosyl hydrolase catalytic domain-containing protein n=1 Tax=Acaromyces ingoldii TaxID=215250 RepID=A0A316YU02_9BASI|nr:hypothetical protein FA10DRAFT_263644 [Acaromyces ingoldii]PWN92907.1 hypothetical protein FA10DRAFT_263644 [Acaromyces ingoldii]